MSRGERVVVVGGGHTAGKLAQFLRQEGFSGEVMLLAEEPHCPYQRPPLSKKYLAGAMSCDHLLLRHRAAYDRDDIELRVGERVVAIDRQEHRVALEHGEELAYDRLVLATGARVRRLAVPNVDAENVFYLRTIQDVDRIRAALASAETVGLVGGGFIGLEAAAVLREMGKRVALVELQDRLLPRVVAPVISDFYYAVHQERGVETSLSFEVAAFEKSGGRVRAIAGSRGELIPTDLVIVGVGVVPNVELAAEAKIHCEDGIRVDSWMRTSDPHIYAVGDCASYFDPHYGRWIRLESVQNAVDQARTAAAHLAGREVTHNAIPWFWSDQYDLKLQMVGLSTGHTSLVVRGDIRERAFSVFYYRAERLVAVDSVNRAAEHMVARRLLSAGGSIPSDAATNTGVPLKNYLPSRSNGRRK